MDNEWPAEMLVAQVRIARPTDQLKAVEKFYCDGVGLKKLTSFEGRGYKGILIGLPNVTYHLEFTQHVDGSPCPAPSLDNLLVLYIPDAKTIEIIKGRLMAMGYREMPPENPYWEKLGVTIEDPDGWRIVLMNTAGI